MRSFIGATVGGTAGAASKISGTVGKGFAALTMDKEYQMKRQQLSSARRQASIRHGMAQGAKGVGLVRYHTKAECHLILRINCNDK